MKVTQQAVLHFQELLWQKASELYREMPWRADTKPYFVLVSEIMLQQTQVSRVKVKFEEFMTRFPTIDILADAPLADVLTVWSGLGYNRRAKYLHKAANVICEEFGGNVPETLNELVSLPGVGPNTAGALLAYSFNQPSLFIETNIRTVLFHHFFNDQSDVSDREVKEVLEQVVDHEHPREFYWAMMDYGSWLKQQGAGGIDRSKHYKKQAPLKGSVREVRGRILKILATGDFNEIELKTQLETWTPVDERYEKAIEGLLADGLIKTEGEKSGRFHLTR